jgi:hypothetical protein
MDVAMTHRPLIASRCAWQALEGEAVVIDLDTRKVMGLNKTASLVWTRMDGKRTVADLVEAVASTFSVEPDVATRDVTAFLSQMQARGLVELA